MDSVLPMNFEMNAHTCLYSYFENVFNLTDSTLHYLVTMTYMQQYHICLYTYDEENKSFWIVKYSYVVWKKRNRISFKIQNQGLRAKYLIP